MIGEVGDLSLVLAEISLHILEGDAFGFRDHQAYPNKLKGHHKSEETEDLSRRKGFHCKGEDQG